MMFLRSDFKAAWHSLLKAPSYTITLVLSIGLPLGVLLVAGALNYHVLLAPLPYPQSEQMIVAKGQLLKEGQLEQDETIAYPALLMLYQESIPDQRTTDETLVAYGAELVQNLAEKPYLATSYITPGYRSLLAVPMQMGRFIHQQEPLHSMEPVAVLSHHSWQRDFQSDPKVLERQLVLNGRSFRIIGVTAPHFQEPKLLGAAQNSTALWLPFDFNGVQPEQRLLWSRTFSGFYLLAKTTADPTLLSRQWSDRINQQFGLETRSIKLLNAFSVRLELVSLREKLTGDHTQLALLLFLTSLTLAFAASSNAGHLVLTRAARLQPHLAIAAALGANQQQLTGRLLAEQLLLMAAALLLATVTASTLLPVSRELLSPYIANSSKLTLTWHSLGFILLVLATLALFFTRLLSRHCHYRQLTAHFVTGKSGAFQYQSRRARALLLVQACLAALLLLVSVQLLQQALMHLQQPLGFQTAHSYLVELHQGERLDAGTPQQIADWQAIRQHLLQQPGVSAVSVTTAPPIHRFGDNQWQTNVSLSADFQPLNRSSGAMIDEHFLSLLAIPVLAGRNVSQQEVQTNAKVVLLNQQLANRLFPQLELSAVIGKPLYWLNSSDRTEPYQVIGVTADLTLPGVAETGRLFIPGFQPSHSVLLVTMHTGATLTSLQLNQWLAQVQPEYAVTSLLSLDQARTQLVANDSITAISTASLSLVVLMLTSLGIYGVLSYSVQLRRFELGVRMAIGARPLTVLRQLLAENFKPVGAGLALAIVLLTAVWFGLQHTPFTIELSTGGFALPLLLIVLLTALTTLLSVWSIIRKPAIYALQGH